MDFNLNTAIEILERTPKVLASLLEGLSDDWILPNEGEETWSAFDVMGHLVHGEMTDWITRSEIILSEKTDKTFAPFDRFAQFEESKGKSMKNLLDEFADLRHKNLIKLKAMAIQPKDLSKTGTHPALGEVTLNHLLSTWVAHDLGHIAQISRVMAKQYKDQVGPWQEYLPILNR